MIIMKKDYIVVVCLLTIKIKKHLLQNSKLVLLVAYTLGLHTFYIYKTIFYRLHTFKG
jgi:hypothetical protein